MREASIKVSKFMAILFSLLLLSTSFSNMVFAYEQHEKNDTPIMDFIRGFSIDFKPPDLILECGSLFFLNVSITKTRCRLPTAFSVSVFLKVKDEYGIPRTTKIGMIPRVYIPVGGREKNVTVPCLTTSNLLSDLYCLRTGEKHEFNPESAQIGVKIDKPVKWGIEALYWRFLTKNFPEFAANLFSNFSGPVWWLIMFMGSWMESMPILNKIGLLYSIQRLNGIKMGMSPSIVWKRTNVTYPFVCTDKINLSYINVDNKTDGKGRFNVTVNMSNGLEIPVNVSIVVDISDEPFFNSLIPSTKETRYNAGFNETCIGAGRWLNWTIKNCSFPKGNFLKKNYTVRVECGPYIPISCSNQFGIYAFTIRWLMFIKPNYKVNASVQNRIRNFWYNLPLYASKGSTEIFPAKNEETLYRGPSSTSIEEVFGNLNKSLKSAKWTLAFIQISTFLLIGFALVGYWFVRKHS